jgi:hypothetical protein
VASRADIGLRLNGRTQRRASSCQTSHAPESTASPLLAPRVSPSLAPIRPAVDHTSFAGIWAWLSRQNNATNSEKHGPLLLRAKPRISPENPRSFAGGASHGFRRVVLGLGRSFIHIVRRFRYMHRSDGEVRKQRLVAGGGEKKKGPGEAKAL